MEQAKRANGWSDAETAALMDEAHFAHDAGIPIKNVFEKMAVRTGRKPNSIRNYYYLKMREQTGSGKTAFVPFSEEETDSLLRSILMGAGAGRSVRSVALELGGGDKKAMLRIQNKYRSLLRSNPERVRAVIDELKCEGVAVRDPFADADSALTSAFSKSMQDISMAGIDVSGLMRELTAISRKIGEYAAERAALFRAEEVLGEYFFKSEKSREISPERCIAELKSVLLTAKMK